ncbi:glycoside hydrolase family 3 C-terminal domain-containing protein, partial [Aduncisulcus paluster]
MINSVIDDRTLHEIYLTPFDIAIRESDPWTMMGAYNKVNGSHACESKILLEDILRDELGYKGLIMSDWSAVVHKTETVRNGLDLEMPGPQARDAEVIQAVQNGDLDESVVDLHARRVLELIDKAVRNKRQVEIDWDAHHALAVKLAEESAVLLKNDGILPLGEKDRIGIIGTFAKEPRFQGGGSSHMNPQKLD